VRAPRRACLRPPYCRSIDTKNVELVEDHKKVAELPNDFPGLAGWNDILTQMRRDRNLADYDAWPDCRAQLNARPSRTVELASQFVQGC
jgi:hypothetical protein